MRVPTAQMAQGQSQAGFELGPCGARDEPSTNGELDYNKSRSMTSSGYPAHSQISPPPTKNPEILHAAKPASIARYRAESSSSLIDSNAANSATPNFSL
jgi:hypothetical protein